MIFININFADIKDMIKNLPKIKQEAIKTTENLLVPAIYAHIQEEARKKLHSTQNPFLENISIRQISSETWVIALDAKYRWIDDGMQPHEMIDNLTKNGKTSKTGAKYRAIPFLHGPNRGPAHSTPWQMDLQSTIRAELKNAQNKLTGGTGIPYAKIEKDGSGNPLLGRLHSFDIDTAPTKTHSGPGQGWGNIGAVRQGYTGIPFLHKIEVYQKMVKQRDGSMKPQRAILTFRTVSTDMKGSGRWFHPGTPPVHIFEEAAEWGMKHWETVVLPKLMDKINKML